MATKLIRQKIKIFDGKIGRNSPDRIKWTITYFYETIVNWVTTEN